jgi:NAD(P)-dependent dehydrogenase (short-subunit alcohol dehydrogenase family)
VARFQREYNGAQPGDPSKAAAAIIRVAGLDDPPLRLLLGSDAVRAVGDAEHARIEADRMWQALSVSTDFEAKAEQPRVVGNARTWLITGASSGLGYALAKYVLEQGDRVAMGARTLDTMADLAERYPGRALALTLDVTSAEQRAAAVQQTEARLGSIDVLVNNAAIDFLGAIEEQDERDVRAQFEVNFFGAVALLRLVLPGMRGRKRGTIVNVSSMDGIASVPVNGYYSSTKFALEGLTESLWQELEPLGLRALLVEPGSFRTGIEQRTKFSGKPIDDYSATSGAFRAMVEKVTPDMFPGDPVRAAAAIYQVVASDRPRHWVVLGSDALRRIGVKLDMQRAEIEAGKDMTLSTDYPGAGRAVL